MKLRNYRTLHFINAIKCDSVRKICNVDSRGKPDFICKNLKDIYEAECATNLHVPSKSDLRDGYENGVEKCPPLAERIISEREHTVNISDEIVSDSDDLLFEKTTLKQLKKRCKAKKRKMSDLVLLSPKRELADSVENENDLNTPLSRWSPKLLKNTKSKKCVKRNISATLVHCIPIKTEFLDSEQLTTGSCASVAIKVEDSPVNYSEGEVMSSIVEVNDGSFFCNEQINSSIEATDGSSISNEQVNLYGMDSTNLLQTYDTTLENKEMILLAGCETCVVNEVCYSHLDNFDPNSFLPPSQKTGQHFSLSPLSEFDKEADIKHSPPSHCFPLIDKSVDDKSLVITSQSCSNLQEISGNETAHQVSDVPLDNGLCCTGFVHGSKVWILEDNATESLDMFNSSQSCSDMPEILHILHNESGYQVSDRATDDGLSCTEIGQGSKSFMFEDITASNLPRNMLNSSMRNLSHNHITSWSCYPCSASRSDLVALENDSPTSEDEKSLMANISGTTGNNSTPSNHLTALVGACSVNEEKHNHLTALEGACSVNEEKQLLISVDTDAKISPSRSANEFLTPETENHDDVEDWQSPERFPSTRKAISPTSQKKLCLAMSSKELNEDIENYRSDSAGVKSLMVGEATARVTGSKSIISPKRILKKPNYNKKLSPPRKGSPTKGRLEGPHLTRSLPGLSTGRTSIENCHESAIAFSQRQMQDIESIAVKLMTELKSMKDIVEEKLLYESYRSTSLKSDSDEVKAALKSATKAKETTKKWLSMMARDCNRFCKIMSQSQRVTEEGSTATEYIVHREKKKISFADEAGGELCQVKFFENSKNYTEFSS